MALLAEQRQPEGAVAGHRQVRPPDRFAGLALMFGSGLSTQFGAASAVLAFPVLGPAGVVAIRQWVAAVVLLAVGRPRIRSFTWAQWWPVLSLAAVFAAMNLSLYVAIGRIGLGLAVTLEFLGPLAVALAASRRVIDLGCALVAGAAAIVLARPQPSSDYLGIALALTAAACWAAYILLNRVIGRRLPGSQGTAAAAGLSGLFYVPIGALTLATHRLTADALGCAAAAGILSSAMPFLSDMLALRRVTPRLYGLFTSVNPVLAALIGLVFLGQGLQGYEWMAIIAIVTANALSAGTISSEHDASRSGQRHPGKAA